MNLAELNIPRLDSFFGLWAIESSAAIAMRDMISQADLKAHMGAAMRSRLATVMDDGIAVIRIDGLMMKHSMSFGGTSTVEARLAIRAAANDDMVKGIMLVMDSPGGTVAGCDSLAKEIRTAAAMKPVHGYGEDLVASAAVWNMSQCSRISVNATCKYGSIGVLSVVEDSSEAHEMLGIKVHRIATGELKGMGTPGTEVTEPMLASLQESADRIQEHFLDAVVEGRGMTRDQVAVLATGGCWVGKDIPTGLIDAIESFDEAMAALRAAAGETESMQSDSQAETVASESLAETPEESEMAAATLQELEAALPNAGSDFVLSELRAESTIEQAKDNYIAHLQLQAEESETALNDANEKLAIKQKTGGKGVDANLNETSTDTDGDDDTASDFANPRAEFRAAVKEHRKKTGASGTASVRHVRDTQPKLYKQMMDHGRQVAASRPVPTQ